MNKSPHDKKGGFLRLKKEEEFFDFWIENSLSLNSSIRKGQYIIRDSTLNEMKVLSGYINLVKIWARK